MRATRAVGAFALLLVSASAASARPTLWERARDPAAVVEERLLVELEQLLDAQERAGHEPSFFRQFVRAGVAAIELSRVKEPHDPRLACDMAKVLIDADVGKNDEAERLLVAALPKLPPGSLRASAWHELGILRALRDDHAGARAAQTQVLELAVEPDERAQALVLRAESELALAELARAESDFRDAALLARDPVTQALARFELGVTLERLGDVPAAFAALESGLLVRLPLATYTTDDPLELPGLDFFPRYERFYLTALVAMTRARHEDDANRRHDDYEQAIEEWDAYVLAADPGAPWVEHARRHREHCEGELRKLPDRHRHPTKKG